MSENINIFTSHIEVAVSDDKAHNGTKYDLEFGETLDQEMYRTKEGVLNKEGCQAFTAVTVEGLIANIHSAHQAGYRDSAEHLRWIIKKLEDGLIAQVEVEIGEW